MAANADTIAVLEALSREAGALASQTLIAANSSCKGIVETVSCDDDGFVWLSGWIDRGYPSELAAVVADRHKDPAGLFMVFYQREGLPAHRTAFIGVMATRWRPALNSEPVIYFGAAGEWHLRVQRPLKVESLEEAIARMDSLRGRYSGGDYSALLHVLHSPKSWVVAPPQSLGTYIRVSVDSMLFVPYFGCFVEGWILSPVKQVADLSVRVGATVLHSAFASYYTKPRPDLADVLPGPDISVERCGFVCAFTGDCVPSDIASPLLKLTFTDGTAATFCVEPRSVGCVGGSVNIAALTRFYPSLAAQPFATDLARAIRRLEQEAVGKCVALHCTPAKRVAIFVLHEDRSDARLVLDQILSRRHQMKSVEIVLVGSRNQTHEIFFDHIHDQLAHGEGAISAFMVDDARYAYYALPTILRAMSAERFLYVAQGIFLSERGWPAALRALASEGLQYLGLANEEPRPKAASGILSQECFVWSTAAFADSQKADPSRLDGSGLALSAAGARVWPGSAGRTRPSVVLNPAQLFGR